MPRAYSDDDSFVDQRFLEVEAIQKPDKLDELAEIKYFLTELFNSDDFVSIIYKSAKKGDKYRPADAGEVMRASEWLKLFDEADKPSDVIDYDVDAGVWARCNALDGNGCKNENVVSFKYCLIECDDIPVDRQLALIKKLKLPCKMVINSGSKSLHAIIKIDAENEFEYKNRVAKLYEICLKNSFPVDTQNGNASRAPRLPGILRSGKYQYIVEKEIGCKDFVEWLDFVECQNDDLPDFTKLSDVIDNPPELAPELIKGILRNNHIMLVQAASKAGKSFSLLELSFAIAYGEKWLGFDCKKGKVLYVNFELDAAECFDRMIKIKNKKCLNNDCIDNLTVWNLRGKTEPLDMLVSKIIRRCKNEDFSTIVIDPIYKIMQGAENEAGDIGRMFNNFDKICNELNCSVIICHHHSKGQQFNRKSIDRGSGSGVLGRSPDAIIDFIELEIKEDVRNQIMRRFEVETLEPVFDKFLPNWRNQVGINADIDKVIKWAYSKGLSDVVAAARANIDSSIDNVSAWRVDCNLRSFANVKPFNMFFCYPVHIVDDDDILANSYAEGEEEKKGIKKVDNTLAVFDRLSRDGDVSFDDFQNELNVSKSQVYRRLKKYKLENINGIITKG